MDFWQVVDKRYSVREFESNVDVPSEVVDRILMAALRAPSAGNRQPWHFYVVRDPETQRDLASAAFGQDFIAQAPVVFVVCADPEQSAERYRDRGRELYCLQDTAIAAEHILLGAVASGFGGCWVGAFDERRAARALNLPHLRRPVAILPVGKPARGAVTRTSRQPLQAVVTRVG
jgi:nitroreductase